MTITRRSFMAGVASVATIRGARAATDVDVAIVGAGAAGLAAAKQVRAAGRSFVVLEARSRTGGRAFTDASLGAPFDAGAEYIHWAERNPMKRIADGLRVPLKDDDAGTGRFMVLRNGRPIPDAERARRRAAFGEVARYITPSGEGDQSFADAVRGAPEALFDAAAGITRMALGEEPERVSIRDYDQLWAGDDYVVPSGYGALVARFGADVPVRLETPVTHVRWDGAGVSLETSRGTIRAKAAIVTAPISLLKRGDIRFTPDLPAAAQAALDGLHMGALTKVGLRLDRARLGDADTVDFFDIGDGGAVTSFDLWPYGRDLAVAAFGGDHARRLCEAGERAAVDFATERLVGAFGARARDAVLAGRLAGWWTDPFAHGSYSIADPGHAAAREALRAPIGERLWLAGEATAGGGAMTVGGAYLEGERAAQEALKVG
jgi:monoamine oxidase